MGFTLGYNGKLYKAAAAFSSGSGADDATWTLAGNVRDVTTSLERGEADITARDNDGWEATAATLKSATLEFQMRYDPDDTVLFAAVRDAFMNGTEITLAAMDGLIATNGKQGLASNFVVTNFTRNEQLREAMVVDVTLKPSSFTEWYEVGVS